MDTATPSDMPSATADPASDARWISLRELAELRGISQHSATRLVRRHGWRRQRDNRGHVLALVPIEVLSRQSDTPSATAEDQGEGQPSAGSGDVTGIIAALKAAYDHRAQADAATIEALQALATAAERTRVDAEARADRAEAGRDAERSRADGFADRVRVLQSAFDGLQTEAEARLEQLEQLRTETEAEKQARRQAEEVLQAAETRRAADDAARRGRTLLARIRAAWRGE
jgi:hypothetical protein